MHKPNFFLTAIQSTVNNVRLRYSMKPLLTMVARGFVIEMEPNSFNNNSISLSELRGSCVAVRARNYSLRTNS